MSKTGKALITILLFLSGFSSFSQEDEKENPVLFAEIFYGGGFGKIQGLLGGVELNSQVKKMLFTLRYSQVIGMEISLVPAGFPVLPIVVRSGTIKEISGLIGGRFVKNGHSTSISLGPSYNINTIYNFETETSERSNTIGLSWEANIKWFKKQKKKNKLYYVIPIGKPTSFGSSFGFKLSGNISKRSYVGVSLIGGFGWHKVY